MYGGGNEGQAVMLGNRDTRIEELCRNVKRRSTSSNPGSKDCDRRLNVFYTLSAIDEGLAAFRTP